MGARVNCENLYKNQSQFFLYKKTLKTIFYFKIFIFRIMLIIYTIKIFHQVDHSVENYYKMNEIKK